MPKWESVWDIPKDRITEEWEYLTDEQKIELLTHRKKIAGNWYEFDEDSYIAMEEGSILAEHGEGLYDTWLNLAVQEPPDDILGRIVWTAGVISQLIIAFFTFPAALGCFLLEEAVQSYGMGAFILSSGDQWENLNYYLVGYGDFIDHAEIAAKTLGGVAPITGGPVLMYMEAAKMGHGAFKAVAEAEILKKIEKDEAARIKAFEKANYGDLRLTTTPTRAEIWIDGENTLKLTPETITGLEKGNHEMELRHWDQKRETWDILVFTFNIAAGMKKELHAIIPESITVATEDSAEIASDEEQILPTWINAEVEGERAVDGDTFVTLTGERIRILGIDAPEMGRPWSEEAKQFLHDEIVDKQISLRIQGHLPVDSYGRTLAKCRNYKGDIAVALVAAGLAKVFIADDALYDPTRLNAAQEAAKIRKVGIWSNLP